MSPFLITAKKRACARALLPVLLNKLAHTQHPNVIHRDRELEFRVTCDVCSTALFSQSWLCSKCGRELCQECVDSLTPLCSPATQCSQQTGLSHFLTDLLPVSRFQADELSEAISEMQMLVSQDTPNHARDHELDGIVRQMEAMELGVQEEYSEREAPRFCADNLSDGEFLRYWSLGLPAVVGSIHFQGHWDPSYFIETYGEEPVTLEDCDTGMTQRSNVAEFFQTLITPGKRSFIWKIKVSHIDLPLTSVLSP